MDPFSSMVNLFTDDCHDDNLKPDICGCSLNLIQRFHTCVFIHITEPTFRRCDIKIRQLELAKKRPLACSPSSFIWHLCGLHSELSFHENIRVSVWRPCVSSVSQG